MFERRRQHILPTLLAAGTARTLKHVVTHNAAYSKADSPGLSNPSEQLRSAPPYPAKVPYKPSQMGLCMDGSIDSLDFRQSHCKYYLHWGNASTTALNQESVVRGHITFPPTPSPYAHGSVRHKSGFAPPYTGYAAPPSLWHIQWHVLAGRYLAPRQRL